ncbi:MAG: hypothetical protein K0U93_25630 [Gammaproteobacteria bacterium]|nr:hypothetical protein [Gammaproteobacteria bacterium]
MFVKTCATVGALLLVWLCVDAVETRRDMQSLKIGLHSELTQLNARLDRVARDSRSEVGQLSARLAAASSAPKRGGDSDKLKASLASAKKKLASVEKREKLNTQLAQLQGAYARVLEAEVLSLQKNGTAAAEKLLATKTAIFKSSTLFPKSKSELKGLMGPIDVLAGRWKRGDFKVGATRIKKVLQTALKKRTAS